MALPTLYAPRSIERQELVRGYALEGSPDSAMRKLALTCLWRSAGRTAEIAYITIDNMRWDPFHQAVFVEVPQMCRNILGIYLICSSQEAQKRLRYDHLARRLCKIGVFTL